MDGEQYNNRGAGITMKRVVRLCEVRLEKFKNIAHGIIEMPKSKYSEQCGYSSDILGIFGQNGSGKTAVIEAVAIIKKLLSGGGLRNLPLADYIMYGKDSCTIGVRFSIENENGEDYRFYCVDYEVRFVRAAGSTVQIGAEILRAEKAEDGKLVRRTLIDYDSQRDVDCYLPRCRYEAVARTKEKAHAISAAQRLARLEMASFLFSPEGRSVFGNEEGCADFPLGLILNALHEYANTGLLVVLSAHSALFDLRECAAVPLGMSGPEVVSADDYQRIIDMLPGMNLILQEIIPGLKVEAHSFGRELCRDGREGVRIELFSRKGGSIIPMRCESEGIVRLISLLSVLICVQTDPSVCLLIDGLDSCTFEFLLGELLTVIDDYGKGQLVFTAHSLRPLEVLGKSKLVFTTTNPEKRYIRMRYVKQNNNMRDMYLRTIVLGGQKEELYEETDTNRIARAFRHAGKRT